MKHHHVDQLRSVADLDAVVETPLNARRDRLNRWAEVLERDPDRNLRSLEEIELLPRRERMATRADDSALSVAFADPVLKAQGLAGDTLGDATAFFDLSEREAHRLLCSCMNGRTMQAGPTARRIRGLAASRLRRPSGATVMTFAAVAAPFVVYFLR